MSASIKSEQAIFVAAVGQVPPEQWEAYARAACAGDEALLARVRQLLRAHAEAGSFLDDPAPDLGATVAQPPAREGPGTLVGPYKLLEQIGEGGFGVVYMAEQAQPLRRKVALKVLKPGMDTKQVVARFEAERQALALMDHPNIARVFDGGATASGRPYFVMELVRGVPITAFCDQNQLGIRERLRLFVDVCQAVQHAHQKGIIHRDLKPSNVLVTLHDDRAVVKVIDFGVAKATGPQLTDRTLFTNFAQMIGTPLYMSPEQAQMSGLDVDTRSDIYSLGVLLYELLTGTTPFDRERLRTAGYDEIRRIIREEEAARPSARISTLGQAAATVSASRRSDPKKLSRVIRGELDWIVMKALEKDRNRRYESASAFAADVRRYLGDEPVLACPPSAGYRLGKFLRRNKGRALAAALVVLALVGAGVGSIEAWEQRQVTSLWQQAETAKEKAAEAKRDAEAAREKLAAVEYGRTMQVAHQEWRDNNVPACLALINGTRADLRGWEWRYLYRLCHSEILTIDTFAGGSIGSVLSTAYSSDGSRIVVGCADEKAKVFDAKTGAALLILRGHTAGVKSAAFSRDGSRLVTGSYDGTAKLWNATTGAVILTFKGNAGAVRSAAVSPDGYLVLTGHENGTAKLWDARTGALSQTFTGHAGQVESAAFSPDGSRVVTAGDDETAKVWDAKTATAVLTLSGHTQQVESAAFSPDGSRVVTASFDRTARLWDARSGAPVRTLKGHTDSVYSAAFSPDGARVVTGSWDGTARVWDTKSGEGLLTFKGDTDGVTSASFSPDGSRILTGSHRLSAKVWDASRGLEHYAVEEPAEERLDCGRLQCNPRDIRLAIFNPDHTRILTAGQDKQVRLWDAKSGAELLTFKGHTDVLTSASFSPDGSWVAAAGYDGTARLFDATTGAELLVLKADAPADYTRTVYSPCFSPDGKRIVTGHGDGTTRVWDAKTGAELLTLKGHTSPVVSVCFNADASRVLTGSWDRTARLWDAKSGAELLTLRGHTDNVVQAAFNPDESRIITAGRDRTARLWDVKSGAEVLTLKAPDGIGGASFSRDGSQVLTGGGTRVWDATPAPGARDIDFDAEVRQAAGREK
jgi:WD40 repeat protein/serine/threonine protein kinase